MYIFGHDTTVSRYLGKIRFPAKHLTPNNILILYNRRKPNDYNRNSNMDTVATLMALCSANDIIWSLA